MYMQWMDWVIVGLVVAVVIAIVQFSKRYVSGVADFLSGNRLAGRYLLTVAGEMGSIGAISAIALWEVGYHAGWGAGWWRVLSQPFALIMTLAGWVIYRYRQTRALTLAQFFEQRYSRRFRVATGLLMFMAGTINYAIFPAVGARFLMYVCGIPDYTVHVGPLPISLSYAVVMALLLGFGLWVTLRGGQVGIMLSDAIQTIIVVSMTLLVVGYVMHLVNWGQIGEAFMSAPNSETQSMINPFKTSKTRDFNIWFYAIAIFGSFYGRMAWQGNSGYNAAAKSPHEARMAGVLAILRSNNLMTILGFMAIAAYTIMHHPDFAGIAEAARERLVQITNPAVYKQMTVPITISSVLPVGLLGCLVTLIVSMAITTDDTYLHSWGSIFIQDVVMPLRKKPFTPEAHMKALRWSICGVAVFAYCFSLFFRQTGYILMFFALTGAIFTAGAGSCIIGGLYWKRGTTSGAWAALIAGAVLSVSGILIHQQPFSRVPFEVQAPGAVSLTVNDVAAVQENGVWTCRVPFWRNEEWLVTRVDMIRKDGTAFSGVQYYSYGINAPPVERPEALWPEEMSGVRVNISGDGLIPVGESVAARLFCRIRSINGQWMWFFSMLCSIALYVIISLAGRKVYNLDKLLHRGEYQTDDVKDKKPVRGWRALFGINSHFTKGDKIIYFGVICWSYGWVIVNMTILAISLIRGTLSDDFWIGYFKIQLYLFLLMTLITLFWFGAGAVKDSIELARGLKAARRDAADDGWVDHNKGTTEK